VELKTLAVELKTLAVELKTLAVVEDPANSFYIVNLPIVVNTTTFSLSNYLVFL
jgi:hypothetical protein